MSQELAIAWLRLARSSIDAADSLTPAHVRSSISRSYYAAFAAAHAILIHAGEHPREREGTWTHQDVPEVLRNTLRRGTVPVPEHVATRLRNCLINCRNGREDADYIPLRTIGSDKAKKMKCDAGQVVFWAEETIDEPS